MATTVTMVVAILGGVLSLSSVIYGQDVREINCPVPELIRNGRFLTTGLYVGSTVTYECFADYELVGENQATCLKDGSWSNIKTTCERIRCPDPTRIPNAGFPVPDPVVGNTVTYHCFPGYTLNGQATLECKADKIWFPELPSCTKTRCPQPRIENGQYTATSSSLTVGARVTYQCNVGHELVGNVGATCQTKGTWSSQPPTCKAIRCPRPLAIANGGVSVTGATAGSRVNYACDDGFRLVGNSQASCLTSGTWSSKAPTCEPNYLPRTIACPLPPNIPNGRYTHGGNTVGSRAYYTCDEGFEIFDKETSMCQIDGTWSDSPTCRATHCPRPRPIANGDVTYTMYTIGSEVRFTCTQGHRLQGQSKATCQADGKWSAAFPVCIPISCSVPATVENCVIDYTSTTLGSRAVHTCEKGYQMVGGREAVCQTTGQWSQQPSCAARAPVNCALPRGIAYGRVEYTGTSVGSKIMYRCVRGFRLIGRAQVTCLSNGRWTAAAATCRRINSGSSSDDGNWYNRRNRNGESSSSSED
ncbi:sushi, von Willebrand factor type A, EGF and pentraxin domain-containing protein 1-like [Sycon ciliatum]|uniref:sushi, von Willebrand factor type A, EGF and pentraxin domain-containing protein 1-like n=1 Tax=Sycon ciliatum TaxID=27933 RepID=UPI0031F6D7BD